MPFFYFIQERLDALYTLNNRFLFAALVLQRHQIVSSHKGWAALHLQLVWSYYKGGLIPYAAILRPHLKYAMKANAPTLRTDINQPDKVQRFATRLVRGLHYVPHEDADASELTSSWPSTLSNVKFTLTRLTSSSAHPDLGHEGIYTDNCRDQAVFDAGTVSFLFKS